MFYRLQQEVLLGEGRDDALSDVARPAQHIWSLNQILVDILPVYRLEFCSILNAGILSDNESLLHSVMPVIRSINSLCVIRGALPTEFVRFPPEHVCYRGSSMPHGWLGFFRPGLKYSVPGFLVPPSSSAASAAVAAADWAGPGSRRRRQWGQWRLGGGGGHTANLEQHGRWSAT